MPVGKFVYRFGYCTPLQWAANDEDGSDDESSCAVVIHADTAEDALLWGHRVAAAFVGRLLRAERSYATNGLV